MKKLFALLILIFLTVNAFCGNGTYQGEEPNPGMTDDQLSEIVSTGTNEQSQQAGKILDERHRNDRKNELSKKLNELKAELESIKTGRNNHSDLAKVEAEMNAAYKELNSIYAEIAAEQQANQSANQSQTAQTNSATPGDPVKVSVGVYIQNETDISNKLFEVKRKYESDDKIISSIGRAWTLNLDQRLILGIEPKAAIKYSALIKNYIDFRDKANQLERQIIYDFEIPDIAQGRAVISSKYSRLDSISSSISEIQSESNKDNLDIDTSSYNQAVSEKRAAIDEELRNFENAVSLMNSLRSEAARFYHEAEEYKNTVIAENNRRKELNKKVMFSGTEKNYEETGVNTVTIIDEDGNPHVLTGEDYDSKIWLNDKDRIYESCIKSDGFYTVQERNGNKKIYDESGFLVRMYDRNENYLIINRASDEKIINAETSSGEKYLFEYSGSYIKRIYNERAPEENIVFTYAGNNLAGVKDSDGDTVTMDYDEHGCMKALKKCDDSEVRFSYGQQTADGKFLATQTRNEEGYSEFFEYDVSGKQTDYIDHDGNRTSYFYDENHCTLLEIQPDGSQIKNIYDEDSNLLSSDINGNKTEYEYDNRGNMIQADYEDGSREFLEYGDYDLLIRYTDRDGVKEEYVRDENGNVLEYKKAGQRVYEREYNSKGLVIRETLYGQHSVTSEYEYDQFDNLISETCGGVKKEYEYDNRNRIKKIFQNGKLISEYSYENHLTKKKDYNGLETICQTNGRKDIVSIIQKDTLTGKIHETRIEYDKRHLPVRLYAGNGESEKLAASYLYTKAGRLYCEVLHGEESWIKIYTYKKGIISEVKQFKASEDASLVDEEKIMALLAVAGDNVAVQKYDYEVLSGNIRIESVTDGNGISNLFEYDAYGNLMKTKDGLGQECSLRYSNAGRLKAQQSAFGGWYEYAYDSAGLVSQTGEQGGSLEKIDYYHDGSYKSVTDKNGLVTSYDYDNRGRVERLCDSVRVISYQYDDFDRLINQTLYDRNQGELLYCTAYEYSEDGRYVFITEGEKYKTTQVLDAFGNVIKIIDGNANERSYVYNCKNQLIESYDGYNNKTSYQYTALGKINKITKPEGEETLYKYNYQGVLEEIFDGCGKSYSALYDKSGRLEKEWSRGDCEKRFEYDKAGRVTKIFDGGELSSEYSYNNKGCQKTEKDGKGNVNQYYYDDFGRMEREVNRKNLEQKYFYEADGQLKSKNNFDSSVTNVSYSKDRREVKIKYDDGSLEYTCYDAAGNLFYMENASSKNQYKYDKGGRLIYQKDQLSGEEIIFEYDQAGNRTRLLSSTRELVYSYGKNNELKEIFDNKQRLRVQLSHNKNGREVLRKFGNGISEETLYDKAGRVIAKMQKSERGELLWGEGYIYDDKGKRSATVDNSGRLTLYEYDSRGRLQNVYYPYSQELAEKIKEEAEDNGLFLNQNVGENKYIPAQLKSKIIPLMNSMQYGLSYNLTNLQIFIKESYEYDANGNRISKTTPHGKIEYSFDKENCLSSSGSNGSSFINFTYDENGNLLSEESSVKSINYKYNSQNRLIFCQIDDRKNKDFLQTSYAYDAMGRRVFIQDQGQPALCSLYDGLSFDVLKQSPVFANGVFTDSNENGIRWDKSGQPNGDRYRYIKDQDTSDNNKYVYIDDESYNTSSGRYSGERNTLYVNGSIAAQTTGTSGAEYYAQDLLGSICSTTGSNGSVKKNNSYDAFGSLIQGNLTDTTDYGYLGKQHDPSTKLYNYGYRDYAPNTARFTTVDPIRDGMNWFAYCNNDPVNFVDPDGLAYYGPEGQRSVNEYVRTTVYVVRNDEGLGDKFNATRYIKKTDAYGKTEWYQDVVGANCRDTYYQENLNTTTPDGIYYLTGKNLTKQADGTYNSNSYANVLALATNDKNLTQQERDTVNIGDRYFHANQKINKDIYTNNKTPESAGCIIGKDGQTHQNEMMAFLMKGVDNPESIVVIIISLSNMGGCNK